MAKNRNTFVSRIDSDLLNLGFYKCSTALGLNKLNKFYLKPRSTVLVSSNFL